MSTVGVGVASGLAVISDPTREFLLAMDGGLGGMALTESR
jgi:hypothetical protein